MAEDKKVQDTEVKSEEVKASEKKETKTTKSKSKTTKSKDIKVRVLCSNAAGKYKLPYSRGVIATLPEQQALEMIDNEDATEDLNAHRK